MWHYCTKTTKCSFQKEKKRKTQNSWKQTSEPWPKPVVVTVQEPIQDSGEDCAVVVGAHLLLSFWG